MFKHYCFAFIFFAALISTPAFAGSVAQTLYELNWAKRCGGASSSDVRMVSQCLNSPVERNQADLDRTSEYLIFKPIAKAEHDQLECMLSTARQLRDSPELQAAAADASCTKLSKLKEAVDNVNHYQKLLKPLLNHIPGKEEEMSAEEFRKNQIRIAALKESLAHEQQIIQTIRSTDTLLGSPEVYGAIQARFTPPEFLAIQVGAADSPEKACAYLKANSKKLLDKDVLGLKRAKTNLDEKLSDPKWIDNDSIKQHLWTSGSRGATVNPLSGNQDLQKSVLCRMEGRYGQGADLRDGLYASALSVVGFATGGLGDLFLGASAVAESANATAFAARVAALGLSTSVQLAMGAQQVYQACAHQVNVSSRENLCQAKNPQEFKSLFYQKIAQDNCAWTASLALLSGGVSAVSAVRNARKLFVAEEKFAAGEISVGPHDLSDLLSAAKPDANFHQGLSGLLDAGGTEVKEGLVTMAQNGRIDQVKKLAQEYQEGGVANLPKIRSDVIAARAEISKSIFDSTPSRSVVSLKKVSADRKLEIASYGSLKPFRQTDQDVYKMRSSYPGLSQNIDQQAALINQGDAKAKIAYASQIPGLSYQNAMEIEKADPLIKTAVKNVWNQMQDNAAMARYAKALAEDAAVEMMKSGTARNLDALARGELTRSAVIKVLIKRHHSLGNKNFSIIINPSNDEVVNSERMKRPSKTLNAGSNQEFQSAIKQGPFIDKALAGDGHGAYAHMLQMDYVSSVVDTSTQGDPKVFWNFLGSPQGIRYWRPLFDSGEKDFTRPEYVNQELDFLKLSDSSGR